MFRSSQLHSSSHKRSDRTPRGSYKDSGDHKDSGPKSTVTSSVIDIVILPIKEIAKAGEIIRKVVVVIVEVELTVVAMKKSHRSWSEGRNACDNFKTTVTVITTVLNVVIHVVNLLNVEITKSAEVIDIGRSRCGDQIGCSG
ncbi:hypothetical protein QAD02_023132 [Eretmocerus hayati]|uniref:Uncharacterized protein n=1 Tax=Eretmocerus hayati TaxID=131215 RepID=A0ACC2PV24_9HYME|nr:hypothetical protein QAD02_023132 [Eretmocerus hayati]